MFLDIYITPESENNFSKKCDIPSEGLKQQYVPNLVEEGGTYELEVREIEHEVFFQEMMLFIE